jgi:hypothetical protein
VKKQMRGAMGVALAILLIGGAVAAIALIPPGGQKSDSLSERLAIERAKADAAFADLAAATSEPVKKSYVESVEARQGKNVLGALESYARAGAAENKSDADRRVADRAAENVFAGSIEAIQQDAREGRSMKPLTKPLEAAAKATDDPDARQLFEKVAEVTKADDPNSKEAKAKAEEALVAAGKVLEKKPAAEGLPPGDPKLNEYATDIRRLQAAIKAGQNVAQNTKELLEKAGLAKTRIGELMSKGANLVNEVAGPAMSIANALGDVMNTVKDWDNKSDVEKIAGVCGFLGSVLQALQPLLTAAAAQYKVPVMLALTLLAKLLPAIKMFDLKLPGPDLGGDNGKPGGGDGDTDKKDPKHSDKPGGKPQNSDKPPKPDKPEPGKPPPGQEAKDQVTKDVEDSAGKKLGGQANPTDAQKQRATAEAAADQAVKQGVVPPEGRDEVYDLVLAELKNEALSDLGYLARKAAGVLAKKYPTQFAGGSRGGK